MESPSAGYPDKNDVKAMTDGICASISSGEPTCLLEVNGVGRSTLLRTSSTLQLKLGEEIRIQGRGTETHADKQLSCVISAAPTEKHDLRDMPVTELVGLGRTPYTGFWGVLTREDEHMAEHSIALVGIPHLVYRVVHTLSDGEHQKVMIVKALAWGAPVIYLDEPTAFLGFPSKTGMMQLLYRLGKRTNKTIFLSTHDLGLVPQVVDKIWLMGKANGVTIGTPEDLSLNDSPGSFSAYKGIAFDPESRLFRVGNEYASQVRLSGSGQGYVMMRKVLQCNDIFTGRDVEAETHVETDGRAEGGNEVFVVHQPGREPVCLSDIGEVLAKLLPELISYGKE